LSIKRNFIKSLIVISAVALLLVIGVIWYDLSDGNLFISKKVYSGKYSSMFETSLFEPDANEKNEKWWLDFEKNLNDPCIKSMTSNDKFSIKISQIKVEGKLSWPGHYGYLGLSERRLLASKILEVKDIQSRSLLPPRFQESAMVGSDNSK
jgi:hypothetical protein